MQGFVIMAEWLEPVKNLGGPHAFFCVRQDYEELEKQLKQVFKERHHPPSADKDIKRT